MRYSVVKPFEEVLFLAVIRILEENDVWVLAHCDSLLNARSCYDLHVSI